jgi:transketolase
MNRRHSPTAIVLTRQKLPLIERSGQFDIDLVARGAYIVREWGLKPEIIIIATGSEVQLAISAGINLKEKGVNARVVSMPSWELFDEQEKSYRQMILPPEVKARISVEAGRTTGWQRYIGEDGLAIGVDRFGVSAPWQMAYGYLGLTVERIVDEALRLLGR